MTQRYWLRATNAEPGTLEWVSKRGIGVMAEQMRLWLTLDGPGAIAGPPFDAWSTEP